MSQFFEYTENGIRFKGFQDLRKTLVDAWEATFGSGIDTSPTSPDGHHIDLETATINSVAELIQAVTTTFNRNQATGEYLDLLAAILGIERQEGETDAELRIRMDAADTSGLATYDGMLTYLQNSIGSDIGLIKNDEPNTDDDGIPGHSFRVVVSNTNSATNDEVAQAIWACKPAGIKADGNTSGTAIDNAGIKQVVKFSRPTTVNIEVQVVLTLYTEEAFPTAGDIAVQDAILGWANGTDGWDKAEFTPGKDVIPARFYTPILTVPGIDSAEIKVRKEGDVEWESSNIPISSQQIANLSAVSVSIGE